VLGEKDIYNFVFALMSRVVTMLWRKQQKDNPNAELGTSEDNPQYRWNDHEWRVPKYQHWYADNSDYQTDERRYWGSQVWAMWASVGVGIATLIAAVVAAFVAYWAYTAASNAVFEAQKQTAQAVRQADAAVSGNDISRAANRAWLFVEFVSRDRFERTDRTPRFNIDITFKITNFGQAPAIIESLESHMFWNSNIPGFYEPDPIIDKTYQEDLFGGLIEPTRNIMIADQHPFRSGDASSFNRVATNQIIVKGGAGELHLIFNGNYKFQRPAVTGGFASNNILFFCIIHYKDVHGLNGETGYYARIDASGRGTLRPTPEHEKYNYWK
jgi:hypothetical protein